MALVTILTPTYNRGANLEALFASLKAQTSRNFVWLVVDDGSTDDTRQRVDAFRQQADFVMQYLYKPNGGKHTALNTGISAIDTELTFIVDSDDTLYPNAVETIERYYEKYRQVPGVGVWSFLRCNTRHGILVQMPQEETVGSYVSERIKTPRPGDMAEVFRTEALRAFPFPVFAGERFLSEDVVWIPLGLQYQTVFINRPIYAFEYLEDGLTCNDKRHKFASPLGSMLRGKMLMKKQCGWKANLKGAIIYNCFKREVCGEIPACVRCKGVRERLLVVLTSPFGGLFYRKWKAQMGAQE